MKQYIIGFVAGVIITVVAFFGLSYLMFPKENRTQNMIGLTRIENGEVFSGKQVQVFQVLEPNMALAHVTNKPEEIFDKDAFVVLYVAEKSANLYDKQKINVPSGKVIKRVGTYAYYNKDKLQKTVPAVEIK